MGFHPSDVVVPAELRTDHLWLRPLRATDVERDYQAVMSSVPELRAWSQSDWPADDFMLAENLADLERHEREHLEGVAFTYTVLDPGGATCLGCVYFTPLRPETEALLGASGHAAQLGFWVRTAERSRDLDRHLLTALLDWLANGWPFDHVVFAISRRDERQVALLREAGLGEPMALDLADGRSCWAFRWSQARQGS